MGRALESAVGAHLLNQKRVENFDLNYWRHGNKEVDFVLTQNSKIVNLEVKSGRKLKKPAGLIDFDNHFGESKKYLIGTGGIPFKNFFKYQSPNYFRYLDSKNYISPFIKV